MAKSKSLKITQKKSVISEKQNQRDTLRSLGFKRVGETVVREDTDLPHNDVTLIALVPSVE